MTARVVPAARPLVDDWRDNLLNHAEEGEWMHVNCFPLSKGRQYPREPSRLEVRLLFAPLFHLSLNYPYPQLLRALPNNVNMVCIKLKLTFAAAEAVQALGAAQGESALPTRLSPSARSNAFLQSQGKALRHSDKLHPRRSSSQLSSFTSTAS